MNEGDPRAFEGERTLGLVMGGEEPGLALFFSFAPAECFFLICTILEMPVRFSHLRRSVLHLFEFVILHLLSHSDLSLLAQVFFLDALAAPFFTPMPIAEGRGCLGCPVPTSPCRNGCQGQTLGIQ